MESLTEKIYRLLDHKFDIEIVDKRIKIVFKDKNIMKGVFSIIPIDAWLYVVDHLENSEADEIAENHHKNLDHIFTDWSNQKVGFVTKPEDWI